jgi:hypothetical protein
MYYPGIPYALHQIRAAASTLAVQCNAKDVRKRPALALPGHSRATAKLFTGSHYLDESMHANDEPFAL